MMTDKVVWIDLELTCLDVEKARILEVACCITDYTFKDIIKGPSIVINASEAELGRMNKWSSKQHKKSGLTDLCRKSTITITEADEAVLNFLKQHVQPGAAALAGSCIYIDRLFLMKHMPKIYGYLNNKIIDVSSFWEIIKRWNPSMMENLPARSYNHRASEDVTDSIKLLSYFCEDIFKPS